MPRPDARLVLLRHGETEWSRTGRHTGRADIPLNPDGEAQAHLAGRVLAGLGLRGPLVWSSPRHRALRTADLAGLRVHQVREDLAEWDYGRYEGLTTAQIRATVPGWTVWTHRCPGGEAAAAVRARADLVLAEVAPMLEDFDVVLVGHGHFSRVLVARWVGLPVRQGQRFAMAAAAVTVLGLEHGAAQVAALNLAGGPS